jgi:hypothetical protein
MQRTIGGADDLRGFYQYRFRDKNLLLFNLEYRLGVAEFLDLSVFGDAGRVFSRRSDFGLGDMEGSLGSGATLKVLERVLLRMDIAVSREGVRLWFRGEHSF